MNYYFAPMEGLTTAPYRMLHSRFFPGIAKYYMPFVSPTQEHRFTPRELSQLLPERNEGVPVVPQILANNSEHIIWAAREMQKMGYREVNLNLGCPSQTVTAKRKGAGLLAYPDLLDGILSDIFSACDIKLSIKTRLGIAAPDEFAKILEIYGKYPIYELTVHARVSKDYYKLPARPEALLPYINNIKAPLCYNGDISSRPSAERAVAAFPTAAALMLGRGLVENPALVSFLQTGQVPEKSVFKAFHDELFAAYQAELWSENALLCHMKELWALMAGLFEDEKKCAKAIRKASHTSDYLTAVSAMFARPLKNLE